MYSPPLPEPNFDRIARLYRWAEYLALGPLLQQTRITFLSQLSGCKHALLFGDGDGRFLARLLRTYPEVRVTAVDTSAMMLQLAGLHSHRACSTASARLLTVQASALDVVIPPCTDLIVTHFFLDCLSQSAVDALVTRIAAAVQPGTRWLVSDFAIPATPLLRLAARAYVRALYLAFRLLAGLRVQRLPDPQAALAANGFRRLAQRHRLGGLLYSELWVLERPSEAQRHNPAVSGFIHHPMQTQQTDAGSSDKSTPIPPDAQPDPEPAVPSLTEPDPGVFHHDLGTAPTTGGSSNANRTPESQRIPSV